MNPQIEKMVINRFSLADLSPSSLLELYNSKDLTAEQFRIVEHEILERISSTRSGSGRVGFCESFREAFIKVGGEEKAFLHLPLEVGIDLLESFDFVPEREVPRCKLGDLSVELKVLRSKLSDKEVKLCFVSVWFH